MDAFLAYGDRAVPIVRSRQGEHPTGVRLNATAEKRDRERRTLRMLAHRRLRAEVREILARPEGPRLRALLRWMRSLTIDDAGDFFDVLAGETWLLSGPPDLRRVAQRLIGREIDRIRRRAGLHPLDDPLPWDADGLPVPSVHAAIRTILNLR